MPSFVGYIYIIYSSPQMGGGCMRSKDSLREVVPQHGVLKIIRGKAKRSKKSTLTMKQIDKEIAAYRRERGLSNAPPQFSK